VYNIVRNVHNKQGLKGAWHEQGVLMKYTIQGFMLWIAILVLTGVGVYKTTEENKFLQEKKAARAVIKKEYPNAENITVFKGESPGWTDVFFNKGTNEGEYTRWQAVIENGKIVRGPIIHGAY
jgi:hypothetical protein